MEQACDGALTDKALETMSNADQQGLIASGQSGVMQVMEETGVASILMGGRRLQGDDGVTPHTILRRSGLVVA